MRRVCVCVNYVLWMIYLYVQKRKKRLQRGNIIITQHMNPYRKPFGSENCLLLMFRHWREGAHTVLSTKNNLMAALVALGLQILDGGE